MGKDDHDITKEISAEENTRAFVKEAEACITHMFESCRKNKTEAKYIQRCCQKVVREDEIRHIAQSASGFDSCIFLKIFPTWCARNFSDITP